MRFFSRRPKPQHRAPARPRGYVGTRRADEYGNLLLVEGPELVGRINPDWAATDVIPLIPVLVHETVDEILADVPALLGRRAVTR